MSFWVIHVYVGHGYSNLVCTSHSQATLLTLGIILNIRSEILWKCLHIRKFTLFCFIVLYFSMSFRCHSYSRIGRWLSWKGHKDLHWFFILIFFLWNLQLSRNLSSWQVFVQFCTKKPWKWSFAAINHFLFVITSLILVFLRTQCHSIREM